MLTKYCIDESIKNWDLYLNQALFATRIRTHIIIDFSLFYLLYEINSHLSKNVEESSSNLYDERIDSASFLSRDRTIAFKTIMTRVKKTKSSEMQKSKNLRSLSKTWFLFESKSRRSSKWIDMSSMRWYDVRFWTHMFLNHLRVLSISILSAMIEWSWSM